MAQVLSSIVAKVTPREIRRQRFSDSSSFSANQTLISDWYGASRRLAAFFSPASSVSGSGKVIDRVSVQVA